MALKHFVLTPEQPRTNRFLLDFQLYGYEFSTALVVRVLQLSLPDESTAMMVALASAIIEVATRIFFYVMFLKANLKHQHMSADDKENYAKRGKLRVQDASNDMVVEVSRGR